MVVPPPPASEPTRITNVGALWAGGAACAVVAALVALVGVIVCEDVLDLEMAPPPLLPIGSSLSIQYALTSAVLALAATGVAHVLALTTPRPTAFFSWIVGLATVVGVALSLGSTGSWPARFATAVVNLVIGLADLDARAFRTRQDDRAGAARSLALTRPVRPDDTPARRSVTPHGDPRGYAGEGARGGAAVMQAAA